MNKPKFDPNKPFEVVDGVKPKFDPNKPFEVVDDSDFFSKETAMKALDYGIRGLDYGGGLVRTGVANVAGLLSGKGNIVTEEDLGNAFRGKAPTSAQYLERLGMPEGNMKVNVPVIGPVNTRDVYGFVGDVVTDPLSLVAKGAKGARRLLQPASAVTETAGEKTFKSGLKKIDERLVEKGRKPVSDLLMKEGASGTTKQIAAKADDLLKGYKSQRDLLYGIADDAGARVDMTAVTKGAEKEIAKLRSNPGLRDTADKLEELLNKYKSEGYVDVPSLSEWKTQLYNTLPANAFDPKGKLKGPVKNFEKVLARDFKNAIESATDSVAPGLGKQINELNEKMGVILEAQQPIRMQVRRGETPNYVTAVDAMLAGTTGAYTGDPLAALGVVGLKKAADATKTTAFRTKAGQKLRKAGQSNIPDALIRRGLINANREE